MKDMRSMFILVRHDPERIEVALRASCMDSAVASVAVARKVTPEGHDFVGYDITAPPNKSGTGSNGRRRKVKIFFMRTDSRRETRSIEYLREHFSSVWEASRGLAAAQPIPQ